MVRRLFLVPFGVALAVAAGALFFLLAALLDPVMARLTGDTLFVGFWSLIDAIFQVDDPGLVLAGAMTGLSQLALTLLVVPPAFVALVGEVVGIRSVAWYAGGAGLLTAAIPWLLRGEARIGSTDEIHVTLVLGLTGAVAGLVYWLFAGRNARQSAAG